MNIDEFVAERKGEWETLERIAGQFGLARSRKVSQEDLWELSRLYTAAVSDLAVLKSSRLATDANNEVIQYLNGLVIRVHGAIYRKSPLNWWSIWEFVVFGFPSALRRAHTYVFLATGIFLFSGLVGFVLGMREPGFVELVVPETIIGAVEKGRVWFKDLHAIAPQASSLLMTHNVSVTFLMVAAGITFGLGTVYLLVLNGLLLGTVAALCSKHGLALEFWSFVLPHGSLELSAVAIAGAAGLVIGHALLDPGRYRRSEFLALRSRAAIKLAAGCIPLLVLAGLIEGFFSPSPAPAWLKLVFAAILFAFFLLFVCLSGMRPENGNPPPGQNFRKLPYMTNH